MSRGFGSARSPLTGRRIRTGVPCHIRHSDRGLSPEETVEAYRSKGFQCLCTTDCCQVVPIAHLNTTAAANV